MSIAEKLTTVAEKIPKVYEAGKKVEYDIFWDAYQNGGNRTVYNHAFRYSCWNNTNFKPKYNIVPESLDYGFALCDVADLSVLLQKQGVVLDTSKCTSMTAAFQGSPNLKRVPKLDLSSITENKAINLFNTCQKLAEIEELVFSSAITNAGSMFNWCSALKKIKISGTIAVTIDLKHCPLTAESLASVVEHLSSATSGKNATFLTSAVNNADWSTTEYDGWDALIATKPNWTFTLA